MTSDATSSSTAGEWSCPRCGYSLEGLPALACPECGRETSEAELRQLNRLRELPRSLDQIAKGGIIATFMAWGWSLAGLLTNTKDHAFFIGSLVVCSIAFPLAHRVRTRLKAIHRRHEIGAWLAAHATWIAPLATAAALRWT